MLVLTSLAGGDKHGYALVQDIEDFAGITLGPGTLYGALTRLEREGLIEALPATYRRRPYRITQAGRGALGARLSQTAQVVQLGMARIGTTSP